MDLEDAAVMRDLRLLLVVTRKADLEYERLPPEVKAGIEREHRYPEEALDPLVPVLAALPPGFRRRLEMTLLKVFTLLGVPAEEPPPSLRLIEPAS